MNDSGDLDAWCDDPIVQALRAPGTPAELAGEGEVLATYRATMPRHSLRRVIGRFGVGGTAVVGVIAMSGGVAAAAYTQALPAPVQTIAHHVFGAVGVPAKPPSRPHRQGAAPAPRQAPSPTTTPTADAGGKTTRPHRPAAAEPSSSPSPTSAPSPTQAPTSTPVQTPSPTIRPIPPTRPKAAAISIAAPSRRVSAGDVVVVSGTVTSTSGQPIPNRAVRLVERPAGASVRTVVARARTSADGTVVLDTAPIERTTVVRLIVGKKAHSKRLRIVLVPTVSASAGGGVVTVSTTGAQPGDTVKLLRRTRSGYAVMRKGQLDAAGSVTFSVRPPKKQIRCVVRLAGTPAHAFARTRLVLKPEVPADRAGATPTPSGRSDPVGSAGDAATS